MSVMIGDLSCPEGVWTKLTVIAQPVALLVHNKGVGQVLLKKSAGAPSNTSGAIPLAPGAGRGPEDIAVWGLDVWALSPWRDGLVAIEARIEGGAPPPPPMALTVLSSEIGPLTTGIAQTAGATGLVVPATASGASMVVTAALSTASQVNLTPPAADWIPDATGVVEPMTVTWDYPGGNPRWRMFVAHLNAPTAGAGSVRLRHPDGAGGWISIFPSTAAVHHLSGAVSVNSASGSTISSTTAIADAFTTPAGQSLTFAVAVAHTNTTGVDPAPVSTGVGDVALAHWTGGNTVANGALRHLAYAADASAAVSVGASWTGVGDGFIQRVTLVAAP